MLPIVLACAVLGSRWKHQSIIVECDNMAVVAVWAAQSSKHPLKMHLLRYINFICAPFDLDLQIVHIQEKDNVLADAVSHNMMQVLYREAPTLNTHTTLINPALWEREFLRTF